MAVCLVIFQVRLAWQFALFVYYLTLLVLERAGLIITNVQLFKENEQNYFHQATQALPNQSPKHFIFYFNHLMV